MSALTQYRAWIYLKCFNRWPHTQVTDISAGSKEEEIQTYTECISYVRPSSKGWGIMVTDTFTGHYLLWHNHSQCTQLWSHTAFLKEVIFGSHHFYKLASVNCRGPLTEREMEKKDMGGIPKSKPQVRLGCMACQFQMVDQKV